MAHLFTPLTNPYSTSYNGLMSREAMSREAMSREAMSREAMSREAMSQDRRSSSPGISSLMSPISALVTPNKKHNDILQYLIILTKDDYKPTLFHRSVYDKLLEKSDLFMGILNIEKLEDVIKSNYYQIEGNITPRTLYIRLPKEKQYVLADVFQERYLDSKINELIAIFSTLCSKSITMSVIHENASSIKLNIGGGVNIKGVDMKATAKKEKESNSKTSTLREITFQEPEKNKQLDINIFGDYNKFFYLPKDESWLNIIRRRVNNKASGDIFKYNYNDYTCVSKELSAHLKVLHINLQYNTSKYDNLQIEYDVDYFPFTYEVEKVAEVPDDVFDIINKFFKLF